MKWKISRNNNKSLISQECSTDDESRITSKSFFYIVDNDAKPVVIINGRRISKAFIGLFSAGLLSRGLLLSLFMHVSVLPSDVKINK